MTTCELAALGMIKCANLEDHCNYEGRCPTFTKIKVSSST